MSAVASFKHEVRPLLRELLAAGCRVTKTARGHIRVTTPRGKMLVTAGTPSDWRAWRNFLADLRRAGVELPGADR